MNDFVDLMISFGMDADSYNIYTDRTGYKITPLHWAVYKNKGIGRAIFSGENFDSAGMGFVKICRVWQLSHLNIAL